MLVLFILQEVHFLLVCSFNNFYFSSAAELNSIEATTSPWQPVANTAGPHWSSVTSDSAGKNMVACSYGSGIFVSNDFGWTWTDTNNLKNIDLYNIASSASGEIVIVSSVSIGPSTGGVYVSNNYGYNWTVTSLSWGEFWYGVSTDDEGLNMAAVHDSAGSSGDGAIYYSGDSGRTWLPSSDAPSRNWRSVACSSSGQNLVANTYDTDVLVIGGMYSSSDYGIEWTEERLDVQTWNSIACDAACKYAVTVDTTGVILTSSNGGGRWVNTNYNPDLEWYSVASDSTGMYLLVTSTNGGIYRSVDYGDNWFDAQALESGNWYGVATDSTGQRAVAVNKYDGIYIANFTFSSAPTRAPTKAPTTKPVNPPSAHPTTHIPSAKPTAGPTFVPSAVPSLIPTVMPTTGEPTMEPTTAVPLVTPTADPTADPTAAPSTGPTAPTVDPSATPSAILSVIPSEVPSGPPSAGPTVAPTEHLSLNPTAAPSVGPTAPTANPSAAPSAIPSAIPPEVSSGPPSAGPTVSPTAHLSLNPTAAPSTAVSSAAPSTVPTLPISTSAIPSVPPTTTPAIIPTIMPSLLPTAQPSAMPTPAPTMNASSNQQVAFYSNITFSGLSSANLDVNNQDCIVATSAAIMHLNAYQVTFVISIMLSTLSAPQNQHQLRALHALRSVVPLATTGLVQVTIFSQAPLAGAPYSSADAYYDVMSSALNASIADGSYDSLLQQNEPLYQATQIAAAQATGATSSPPTVNTITPFSVAPSALPTASPADESSDLALEVTSTFPGIAMMLVGFVVLFYRRKRAESLNEMRQRWGGEYVDILVRSVTVVLAMNVLLTQSFTAVNHTFVLLMLSRLLILSLSLLYFGLFMCPASTELGRSTSLSMMMNMEALRDAGANTMYSAVIIVSMFDTSMLRYLPWHRTTFTGVMEGFPDTLLLRCSLYGTFLSSILQAAALFPSLHPGSASDSDTDKGIALLIFTILNLIRSFISIVLNMKRANSAEFKIAIVSEKDVVALADFLHQSASLDRELTAEELQIVRARYPSFTPEKVSEMLVVARSRPTSLRSDTNPLHQDADDFITDERGIRFSAQVNHADETMDIMREQMRTAGLTPLEFIPLPELKAELAQLFECANTGATYDTDRLDYLLLCLDHNPEHKKEQEALNKAWLEEITPFLQESLETTRAFVPPHIFKCSEAALEADGYSKALTKRIMTKKCLWLVRVSTVDIDRMHVVELSGRFNPEAQGLDLVETAAIFAVLPEKFGNDADRRKARWRASLEQNLKTMYAQSKSGTLPGPKKRNAAYKNQLPKYENRDTMHEMSGVSKSNIYGPRTSFLNLSLKSSFSLGTRDRSSASNENTSFSAAGSVSTAGANISNEENAERSYAQRMGAALAQKLHFGGTGSALPTSGEASGTDSRPISVGKLNQKSLNFADELSTTLFQSKSGKVRGATEGDAVL